MDINSFENLIVNKLKENATLNNFLIEVAPDDMQKYRLLHPKGAILVYYKGSSFSQPQGLEGIYQDRTKNFDVLVMIKNLRVGEGCNTILDEVRDHLAGFEIEDSKAYPTKEGLYGQDNGVWKSFVSFACTKSPYVHRADVEEFAKFNKLTVHDSDNDTDEIIFEIDSEE